MKTRTTKWIFLLLAGLMILTFSCKKSSDDNTQPVTTVSDADGNVYHLVTIGTQVWMVENLRTTKFNDGTAIPNINDSTWGSLSTPAYCWYNNDAGWKPVYGALYNWFAVTTGKLAPTGWHIATDAEWATLIAFLGGDSVAGGKLKSTGTVEAITGLWFSPNTGATNSSGFTALPDGYRYSSTNGFDQINRHGYWWTATVNGTSTAWEYDITYNYAESYRNYALKTDGYNVRCVKD